MGSIWLERDETPMVDPRDHSDARAAKQRTLIVTDFDGTLVALQDDPATVTLPNEQRSMLAALGSSASCRLLVVSGRTAAFLERIFEGVPADLAAEHGAMHRLQGLAWEPFAPPIGVEWRAEAERALSELVAAYPGSWVERKDQSFAWHCRTSLQQPSAEELERIGLKLKSAMKTHPVDVLGGHFVIEVKNALISKGVFLRWYLERIRATFKFEELVVFGDDRPDEEMFQVAREHGGSTFHVGDGSLKSGADTRLSAPAEVWRWLERLR